MRMKKSKGEKRRANARKGEQRGARESKGQQRKLKESNGEQGQRRAKKSKIRVITYSFSVLTCVSRLI